MKVSSRGTIRVMTLPALLVALLCGIGILRSPGLAQDAPTAAKATRVAVVDVTVVLQESAEWVDAIERQKALDDEAERVLDPLARELKMLEKDVRDAPFGTKERTDLMAEGRKKDAEFRAMQRDYDRRKQALFESTYRSAMANMEKAAGEYAAAHGIDLVLKKRSVSQTSGQAGLMDLHTQQVLFAAPQLDISRSVIESMNAAYNAPIEDK